MPMLAAVAGDDDMQSRILGVFFFTSLFSLLNFLYTRIRVRNEKPRRSTR